jgi:predicted dehydrogenase
MISVVGLGKIFEYHEIGIRKANLELDLGVDLNWDRLERFDFTSKSDNLESLLDVSGIVLISTPPGIRLQAITNCISARCVLLEKPAALSAGIMQEMVQWSQEQLVPILVLQSRRYFNNYRLLKAIVANHEVTSLKWHEGAPFGWESVGNFHSTEEGSLWNDLGPHVVDSLRFILGDDLTLSVTKSAMSHNQVDLRCQGLYKSREVKVEIDLNRKRLNANWISIELKGGSKVLCKSGSENVVYIRERENSYQVVSPKFSGEIKQPVSSVFREIWADIGRSHFDLLPSISDNIKTIQLLNDLGK